MSRIIPLWERILVEAIQAETETTSWIVLPDSKEKPNEWKDYLILDAEDVLAKIK